MRCSSGSWTSELLDFSIKRKLAGYSATCPELMKKGGSGGERPSDEVLYGHQELTKKGVSGGERPSGGVGAAPPQKEREIIWGCGGSAPTLTQKK